MNIVHVKDESCPMDTGIITKLLKLKNSTTMSIQNLFVPAAEEEPAGQPNGEQWTCCVICQERLVGIALLPCRHVCVCAECFSQIDKCPLCRSYISTFFEIKAGGVEPSADQPTEHPSEKPEEKLNRPEPASPSVAQEPDATSALRPGLFRRINHRLNRMFN